MNIRIGLFLPQSDMFHNLSLDFMNGLKLSLNPMKSKHVNLKYVVEKIGNGSDIEVINKIEKMLLQDEADMIVCFCSYFLLEKLVSIADSFKKPIFHMTLGARVLKNIHLSPFLIHHSLNLTQTSFLSSKYCVKKFGKRVAMLSSFYDGGYHMADAFYNGVLSLNAEIVYNYVSPMDYQAESFESMIEGLKKSNPDFVIMIFSFNESKKIMKLLNENGLSNIYALCIPLMTDESLLTLDTYPHNVLSMASWNFSSDNNNCMKNFILSYERSYHNLPNIISLLGYELGQIVNQIISEKEQMTSQVATFFGDKTISSPRGVIKFNAFNETIPVSFNLRKLERISNKFQNITIEEIDSNESNNIYEIMANFPDTGWKNPYICT